MAARAAAGVTVHSVRSQPHELRFIVEMGGESHEIFARTSFPAVAGADIALALTVIPAMIHGGRLEVDSPVDETLVRCVPEIQAILRAFHDGGDWTPAGPLRHRFELACPAAPPPARRPGRGVGAFFSGGVDSFATLMRNPEISHLIYIAGMDVPVSEAFAEHQARARAAVERIAKRVGKPVLDVETNARELYEGLVGPTFAGGILGAAARLVAPEIGRLYLASSQAHRWLLEASSHPMIDPLWARGALELIHDGAELTRAEKLELIAADELARSELRVCWAGARTHYNCCRCEKCLRTMVALEALDVLDRFESFAEPLDLEAVAATRPSVRHELAYWVESLELAVREGADPELIAAMDAAIASADPGRPPMPIRSPLANPMTADERSLYISPGARAALEGSRAVVFLIGGDDGSGAFGDRAQLRASAGMLAALGEEVAVLPVLGIDRLGMTSEDRPAGADGVDSGHAIGFAGDGAAAESAADELGLIPATLPILECAVTYLYGGDYLNQIDGDRVLRMGEAVAALVRRAGIGSHVLYGSGLQVSPAWARGAGARYRALLRGPARIWVRDPVSLRAVGFLAGDDGGPRPSLSGDDAVGLLAVAAGRSGSPGGDREALTVNMDLGDGDRGAGEEARTEFARGFVAAIGQALGRPTDLQPVVDRDDPRALAAADRLGEELLRAGAVRSVAEPLLLSAAGLDREAPVLRRAEISLGFSYHHALAGLILGVPSVLVREDDAGSAQAADGLRRDFSLPPETLPGLDDDPREAAARAAAVLADPAASAALRAGIEAGARRVTERRARIEAELIGGLRDELERARERGNASAGRSPAEDDYRRLLELQVRTGRRLEAAERAASESELRLREITASASWRWTAPVRGAKGLLDRARHRRMAATATPTPRR